MLQCPIAKHSNLSQGCIASFEISTAYTNMAIGRKVDRIGERQLVVGLTNLLVAVLLLMVLLVKYPLIYYV